MAANRHLAAVFAASTLVFVMVSPGSGALAQVISKPTLWKQGFFILPFGCLLLALLVLAMLRRLRPAGGAHGRG